MSFSTFNRSNFSIAKVQQNGKLMRCSSAADDYLFGDASGSSDSKYFVSLQYHGDDRVAGAEARNHGASTIATKCIALRAGRIRARGRFDTKNTGCRNTKKFKPKRSETHTEPAQSAIEFVVNGGVA